MGQGEMEKLGMGAVIGIAKGSTEEPQFIVMEYWGTSKSKKPVVLVGKGVTFDTGGLNIKPGDAMYEMHMDMSGGSAVIHAVTLAAKLKLKANVVGLIPAVENSPSGTAVRPGDILRSLSGRTIEILNTDAEGRVILADGITYAKRYDPKLVVDVATLTGAALVALGNQANAIMTNKEALIPAIQKLGEESGDYVWPFPAWEEYEDMTKGNFGDIPNISTAGNSRYGGVIAGGHVPPRVCQRPRLPMDTHRHGPSYDLNKQRIPRQRSSGRASAPPSWYYRGIWPLAALSLSKHKSTKARLISSLS
jgi:leucyl aminopeptidase